MILTTSTNDRASSAFSSRTNHFYSADPKTSLVNLYRSFLKNTFAKCLLYLDGFVNRLKKDKNMYLF